MTNNDIENQMFLEEVMENYSNPKNYGKLENFDLKHHVKNISCGDAFDLYLKLKDGIIDEVSFEGQGCAISTASFSMLSEKLKNLSIEEAQKLNEKDIYNILGIRITPSKRNCAMLSLRGIQESIEKLDKK